ncbi:Proteophosphoglycan 5 [Rhodotorula toruloides]|nr:Proteophosphoglycan 5 [Rhodotorula toruloides]
MFAEGDGAVNQEFGGGFDDEMDVDEPVMDVDEPVMGVTEPATALDELGGMGWGGQDDSVDGMQVDQQAELPVSQSRADAPAVQNTNASPARASSPPSTSSASPLLPPPMIDKPYLADKDGVDAAATSAALVDGTDDEDNIPRLTAAQKGKGREVPIVEEEPKMNRLNAARGPGDLEEEFGSGRGEVDAAETLAAGDEDGVTAQARALNINTDFGEYADYDPLDAHKPPSSAQAKPPSPPAAPLSAFPASLSTTTLRIFPNLSDPHRAHSSPTAFFAPDQRDRRLAGLRKVGLELLQRQAPKEEIMNAYVTEFSNLSKYPVRMAELAILVRMQRAQEARHERNKALGTSGSTQRSNGKGKASAAPSDETTSLPDIPTLASPFVTSIDLASIWRFAHFFDPHEDFYADIVASQREMRMEHGEPKDVSGGGLIAHTCPLFGGPTLEEKRRGEDGEWECSCQCPTANEVHAVVEVWPSVFDGSRCHATDASTSHCLGSLNRLNVLLETGDIPPASPRCLPPAYLLEVLRVLQATYFRQLYVYDRIRLDSIVTGGVAASFVFGGSHSTSSRGSSLINESDIFGYAIYVVPLRHFQASGNTRSNDVHGEFTAERALLLSALEVVPILSSPADVASPADPASPANSVSPPSSGSPSTSQRLTAHTAPPNAPIKIRPIIPHPSLDRAAELHDLLDIASGRADCSVTFEDALIAAGVEPDAGGLAALRAISGDLRRRDLCLPSFAGGANSHRSHSSTPASRTASHGASKPQHPDSSAAPGRPATTSQPFEAGESREDASKPKYIEHSAWRKFSDREPHQVLAGTTVNFPVDSPAPGRPILLAHLPRAKQLSIVHKLKDYNKRLQDSFNYVLDSATDDEILSLGHAIPLALLTHFLDDVSAEYLRLQPPRGTPLTIDLATGYQKTLENYVYLLELYARSSDDAYKLLTELKSPTSLDAARLADHFGDFKIWVAGLEARVALGAWDHARSTGGHEMGDAEDTSCFMTGYAGWSIGGRWIAEEYASRPIRPFTHFVAAQRNDPTFVQFLVRQVNSVAERLGIDVDNYLAFVGSVNNCRNIGDERVGMLLEAVASVARATPVSLGGANLAPCGGVHFLGDVMFYLSQLHPQTLVRAAIGIQEIPKAVRVYLERRAPPDITISAATTLVQRRRYARSLATEPEEVEDDGFAADKIKGIRRHKKLSSRGSGAPASSTTVSRQPLPQSAIARAAPTPSQLSRIHNDLLAKLTNAEREQLQPYKSEPFFPALVEAFARGRADMRGSSSLGAIVSRSSIRQGVPVDFLQIKPRQYRVRFVICSGTSVATALVDFSAWEEAKDGIAFYDEDAKVFSVVERERQDRGVIISHGNGPATYQAEWDWDVDLLLKRLHPASPHSAEEGRKRQRAELKRLVQGVFR